MPVRRSLREFHRGLWIAFAVLCASLLIHLAFYVPSHRSTSLLILAAGVALVALGGIAAAALVTFRLTPKPLDRLRARVERWRAVYIGGALLVTFAFGLGMRPEWLYPHIALMLGAGFALGYDLLYGDSRPIPRLWFAAAGVTIVIITAIRIAALSVFPAHYMVDEPQIVGWAISYLRDGYFHDPIMYFGGSDTQRFMLPVAWWISIVGSSYWQIRLFFFMLIVPLTLITARIAHNLYGTGWIAALFMFCSIIVMYVARIRHDIGLAIAVAGSLLLYTEALKRENKYLHLFAGLVIGWGLFAHYHAIGFGVALTVSLYGARYVERLRHGKWLPEAALCLYVLGGLLGLATVVLLQILPDWEGFIAVRQPRNPGSLTDFVEAFLGHWRNVINYSRLEFVLIIAAAALALWRRSRTEITLVLLLFTMHLALALQARYPYEYYVIPVTPVYALLIAGLLRMQWRRHSAALVMAGFILIPNLGLTLQAPIAHLREGGSLDLPVPPAAAWIREHVTPDKRIVAEHDYYLFLIDYQFISPATIQYAPVSKLQSSLELTWDAIDPDVIVEDQNLAWCCGDQPIRDVSYLQSRGYQLIAEFPGDRYPVRIYEKSDEIK